MLKMCSFCDGPIFDDERIVFTGAGTFKSTDSPVSFGIKEDFTIEEMYHDECHWIAFGDQE